MSIGDLWEVHSVDGTEVARVDSSGNLSTTGSVTATSVVSTGAVSGTDGTFSGTVTLSDGSLVQRVGAGTGTGDVIEVIGPDSTHGWKRVVYEATVTPAAIETALVTVPAESYVESVQANVQATLTAGGTTVTFSIGVTGDVDCYGTAGAPTDALVKNTKLNYMNGGPGPGALLGVFSKTAVGVKLIGAATGGATAGNTALSVGSVKVRVIYQTLMPIADAP